MVDGGDAEEGEGEAEGAGGGGAEGGTRGDERRRLGLGDRARLVELVEALPAGEGFVKRSADIVGLERRFQMRWRASVAQPVKPLVPKKFIQ